eukprot:536771_1
MAEIWKRSVLSQSHTIVPKQTWINRFSLLSLFTCVVRLLQLILYTMPTLCVYFNTLYIPTLPILFASLILYKISRLQLCFQTIYHPYFFQISYINGCLFPIYTTVAIYFGGKITLLDNGTCDIIPTPLRSKLFVPIAFWGLSLDLFIECTYIYLIRNVTKCIAMVNNSEKTKKAICKQKTINVYLRKILTLSITIKIVWIITVFVMIKASRSAKFCIFSSQIFMSFLCMYLMIEHNNDKYIKVVKCCNQWKMCCCFAWFINSTIRDGECVVLSDVVASSTGNNTVDKDSAVTVDVINKPETLSENKSTEKTVTDFNDEENKKKEITQSTAHELL